MVGQNHAGRSVRVLEEYLEGIAFGLPCGRADHAQTRITVIRLRTDHERGLADARIALSPSEDGGQSTQNHHDQARTQTLFSHLSADVGSEIARLMEVRWSDAIEHLR